MKSIIQTTIKSIHLENFKGVKNATYQLDGKNASVMGAKLGECNGKIY